MRFVFPASIILASFVFAAASLPALCVFTAAYGIFILDKCLKA